MEQREENEAMEQRTPSCSHVWLSRDRARQGQTRFDYPESRQRKTKSRRKMKVNVDRRSTPVPMADANEQGLAIPRKPLFNI